MESLWPRIEPLLSQVTKPARYIGGELGAQSPEHMPDAAWPGCSSTRTPTRSGLPNQGLQILYEILNERHRRRGRADVRPVGGHGGGHAVGRDPLLLPGEPPAGPSLRRPGLQPVGRAGLHQRPQPDRPGRGARSTAPTGPLDDPMVVAGGHCAFNPEPLADFVDCFVLGDGEEVVGEINEVLAACKGPAARRTASRARHREDAAPGPVPGARGLRPVLLRGPLRVLASGRPRDR